MVAEETSGTIPDKSPLNKKRMYESEYKHAAHLFDQSLEEYTQAENVYKKEAFRKVMNQALQVLKDTATALKKKGLLQQCAQIEQDYQAYKAKSTPETIAKLHEDLGEASRLCRTFSSPGSPSGKATKKRLKK